MSDDRPVPLEMLRGLAGLWQLLIVRSTLRVRIEVERERNRAYADHRDHLPDGAELVDYEDSQGRGLWIRLPARPGPRSVPAVVEPGPAAITGPTHAEGPEPGW